MDNLIVDVSQHLLERNMRMVTAESCTGGLIAASLTAIPGSSDWFEGAFVTYRPGAKIRMLGVSGATIDRYSVVSEPVAREMAIGALAASDADVSVAVTGVAGPSGGDIISPVGTVWFAWAIRDDGIQCVQASEHCLEGDRDQVRHQAVTIALTGILEVVS
ncbi:MAG TPA: CinA family protein [Pseudomonadales bacterium]|nr:CinA family protein [Pseudomonadales bacterium]